LANFLYNVTIMDEQKDNIVGKPSPEMTDALRKQDEIQNQIRNQQEIQDLTSKVVSVLGSREYALTINGQDPTQAIEELQTNTGITVINLGRRYDYGEEPRLFMDAKGRLADWRDRFDREGHEFNEGERVSVPAFIKVETDGYVSLTADDQDGRMADRFFPAEIPVEVRQNLEKYRGIAVGCIVKIRGVIDRGDQLSDIHEYNVELEPEIVLPPINPSPEQVANLPKGARVVTDGKIVKTEIREEVDNFGLKDEHTYVTVEASDGRQITVANWSDKLRYEDGVLENLRDKLLEPGEHIRLASYVHEYQGKKIVHSHWSRPYLVEATEIKLSTNEQLRAVVKSEINTLSKLLEQKDFQEARKTFATTRTKELTKEESDKVMASLAGFPENERPIFYGYERRMSWTADLDEAYGVLVESMTRNEFAEFSREAGSGRKPQTGKHCDASYTLMIMHTNNYDDKTTLSILTDSISERLKRLEQDKGEKVEDWHDDSYMLEQSMGYLTHVKSPEAVKKILEIIRYTMEHKYYDKRMERAQDWGCPYKFLSLLYVSTDKLVSAIRQNPDNIVGIEDLNELLAWQEELTIYPFCNTSVNHLQKVTDMFRIV